MILVNWKKKGVVMDAVRDVSLTFSDSDDEISR